MPSKEKAREKG